MNDDTRTTVDPPGSSTAHEAHRIVGLTVLYHPELARVGDVAPLFSLETGGTRSLHRGEPTFQAPRDSRRASLDTPVVSRNPIELAVTRAGNVRVSAQSGAKLQIVRPDAKGDDDVGAHELERGVLLELNRTVLLLLHFIDDFRSPPPTLGFVGDSIALNRLRRDILRVADLDTSVLLLGESGAGKELAAMAIHENSQRRHTELLTINLAALPKELATSALFGHRRGAFTGAAAPREGYFSVADGGTLFLDEVGELPADVQPLLLRALREKEVQPLGASKPERVDVRVVAATDSNLELRAEAGDFSSPLLHRLRGYTLEVPPLRVRPDDVARLFVHFLRRELEAIGEAYRLDSPAPNTKPWLPLDVIRKTVLHRWRGNVAALQNVVRQLAIANRFERKFQEPQAIRDELDSTKEPQPTASVAPSRLDAPPGRPDPRLIPDSVVAEALAEHGYNVNKTAEALRISQSSLMTRMDECQGVRKARDVEPAEIGDAAAECSDLRALALRLRVSEHGLKLRLRQLEKDGKLDLSAVLGAGR